MKAQTHSNIEHLIMDGGSTDGTLEIIKANYNSNVILISERDNGIYDAMNKGILKSSGQIVGILNSDDLFPDSTILKEIVAEFENDNSLDVIYGDLEYVSKNDIQKIVRIWESKPYFSSFFELGNVPPHPTLFVRRKVYDQIGLFDLNFKLAADYEFMFRLFKKSNLKSRYIPMVIVKMRLGGATNNSLKNIIKGNYEIYNAWKLNGVVMPIGFFPLKLINRIRQFLK